MKTLEQHLQNRVSHICDWARAKYHQEFVLPQIQFSLSRQQLSGQKPGILLFNATRLAENPNDYLQYQVLRETILWISTQVHFDAKQIASDFGLVDIKIPKIPIFVRNENTAKYARTKFAYSCGCGFIMEVGSITHEKAQKGKVMNCKICKSGMQFVMELEPEEVE